MKIVVLAGGTGTRLWPLSRLNSPKQIQPFFGQHTLLQRTIDRLRRGFKKQDIIIVTSHAHKKIVAAQLPGFPRPQILSEPARRNTAAAIGLGAYYIAKRHPRETIVSIAADHYIKEEDKFLRNLRLMGEVIRKNEKAVCLMGVVPTYPETGYGYIELGKQVHIVSGARAYRVKRFIEKPPLARAKRFARSRNYLWNPSYFGWRVDRIQELFQKFIPKTHALLLETVNGNERAFLKINAPPVEYAVLEKLTSDFYVLPASFSWADVGHWASVREIQAKTTEDNVCLGLQVALDTKGSLIYNYTDRILTTIGMQDVLVVQTEDGTLVCRRDRAQDVKKLVEKMHEEKKYHRFL